MSPELLTRIKAFLNQHDLFLGIPATTAQLDYAAEQLGVRLDDDYREFLSLFGGSYVGVPVYGFANCAMLPDEDMVALTVNFRKAYAAANQWPTIQSSYVISMTGSGDPVIIGHTGKVLVYYHDSHEEAMLAESFAELLAQNLPA